MTDKRIKEHKVCKYQIYLYNNDEFIDCVLCNSRKTGLLTCPFILSEAYNCTFYVERGKYDYK